MTQGIGANLTNDEKRAHLMDIRRKYLTDQDAFRKFFLPRNSFYRPNGGFDNHLNALRGVTSVQQ